MVSTVLVLFLNWKRKVLAPDKKLADRRKPTSQISGLEEKSASIKVPVKLYEVSLVCGTS
jgi:hypothetical protein